MIRKNNITKSILCIFLLISLSCVSGIVQEKRTFFRMDTVTEVTLVLRRGTDLNSVWQSLDSLFKDWDDRFSVTGERSEVRRVNERKSDTVVVGRQLADILQTGLNYGDTLDGSFDITVLPLKELWGFSEDAPPDPSLPSSAQIDSVLRYIDYRKVKMNGDTVIFASPEIRIDVGGIAKGFVLREAGKILDRSDPVGYLIAAGGDILAKGTKKSGDPWVVGIRDPKDREGVIGALEIDSGAIVTSGDYERFRIVNGKRYHHIFDPRTGFSCSRNRSVTVKGSDPVEVDILSTGLFCKDAEEVIGFLNARPGLEGAVVDSAGKVFVSSGWKERLKL